MKKYLENKFNTMTKVNHPKLNDYPKRITLDFNGAFAPIEIELDHNHCFSPRGFITKWKVYFYLNNHPEIRQLAVATDGTRLLYGTRKVIEKRLDEIFKYDPSYNGRAFRRAFNRRIREYRSLFSKKNDPLKSQKTKRKFEGSNIKRVFYIQLDNASNSKSTEIYNLLSKTRREKKIAKSKLPVYEICLPVNGRKQYFDGTIVEDPIGDVIIQIEFSEILDSFNQAILGVKNEYWANYSIKVFKLKMAEGDLNVFDLFFILAAILHTHKFKTEFFKMKGLEFYVSAPQPKSEVPVHEINTAGFSIDLNQVKCTSGNLVFPKNPRDLVLPYGALTLNEAICEAIGDPDLGMHFTILEDDIYIRQ